MFCKLCAIAPFLFATSLFGAIPPNLAPFTTFLKANCSIQTVATDAQGFIYVFGDVAPAVLGDYPNQVFVARLDPAATKLTYVVYLGGSSATYGEAMAVDAAGNAYVTGYTDAPDFTTVPPVPGPTTVNAQVPFAAKVNINGTIVYSTLFSNGARAIPRAITVDANGEAIVSGSGADTGFPTTPGAYTNNWISGPPFVTKLSADGSKLVFSVVGVGGSSLALDGSGNVFIAGGATSLAGNPPWYPTTPGAFQTTYTPFNFCVSPACQFLFSAGEQYVTKLSADGSKLIFSTFVTGSQGASNAGMAVDAAGDVWLTGVTQSADYPYTVHQPATAFQAFTTELDPTGSKILLSVPVGVAPGNGNNLAFDPQGNLIAAGTFPVAQQSTFPFPANPPPALAGPSTGNIPPQCLPGSTVYVMRISNKDGSVLGTQIVPGVNYPLGVSTGTNMSVDSLGNVYVAGSTGLPTVPLTPGVFFDSAITGRNVSGTFLERTNFSVPASTIGCVTDSTSMTLLGPIAPGQLVTIYGNGIGPAQPVIGLQGGEISVPTGLGGVSVTFDGQSAPILYASSTQINVQAPFEISQKTSTVMQLNYNGSTLLTRAFAVAPENPCVFAGPTQTSLACGPGFAPSTTLQALALNEDGSINSCANPAAVGSQFTLLVNGTGTSSASRGTGFITGSEPGYDSGSAAVFNGSLSIEVDAFMQQMNAINGIGQITARVPPTIHSLQPMNVTVAIGGLLAGPFSATSTSGANGPPIPVVVFVKP